MVSRAFKLRFRRRLRIRKRQVEAFGQQAEDQLERNLFRRLERLRDVRRFVLSWVLLLVMVGGCMVVQIRALNGYYQSFQPDVGGIFTEGMVGAFSNANPVYANGTVDQAVSHLMFSGLYKYDANNRLVGDLAAGPLEVSADGMVYTAKLRSGLTWHDGRPLTTEDVLFTYQVIQNPDAQSPLNGSWQGIKVASPDPQTLTFTLPSPLASFPYSLTNGIVPKHILGETAMDNMRSAAFNTRNPIGSGPFKWQAIEILGNSLQDRQQQIALQPFDNYHDGRPKLNGFVMHSFRTQADMITSFEHHELTAMAGLDEVPTRLRKDDSVRQYSLPLTAAVMTFFKTSDGILAEMPVRQALIKAADTQSIISSLEHPTKPVKEPFLQGQLGYDPQFAQASFDIAAAQNQLDAAGWKLGKENIRYRDGKPLAFSLFAEDTSEYSKVARALQKQWRKVGADVELRLQDGADFQSTLAFHSYDALLYGVSIGPDPDVYAYWNSSQADMRSQNRLNFSEYNSKAADSALDAGRTRLDPTLRTVKYKPFLQAWQADAPALGLYQPRFLYITRGPLYGLDERYINNAIDRYKNVDEWMIRQKAVSQASLE
jgi:peptide/nickel transport system substrate-binding protein